MDDRRRAVLVGARHLPGGRSSRHVLDAATRDALAPLLARAARANEPLESLSRRRGVPLHAYVHPVFAPDGARVGYLCMVRPTVQAGAWSPPRAGGWQWHVPTHTTRWAEGMFDLYGEPARVVEQSAHEWQSRLDRSEWLGQRQFWDRVESCTSDGALFTDTLRIVRVDDGARRTLVFAGRVFLDVGGRPEWFRGFSFDATELLGSPAVPSRASLLGAMLDLSPALFFVLDLQWREVVYVSRPVEPYFGVPLPRAGHLLDLLHSEDRAALDDRLTEFARLQPGSTLVWTFRLRATDGSVRRVQARVAAANHSASTGEVAQVLCRVEALEPLPIPQVPATDTAS